MENIKNKIVLITGGTGGLGSNFAVFLLREGAKAVVILDLKSSDGDALVKSWENEFGKEKILFLECNITNHACFKECFKKAVDTFGGIDILINNAGVANETDWQKVIDVNFSALVHSTYTALDSMGKRNDGKEATIVNIASIVALMPVKFLPVYGASKHAVLGFSKNMMSCYKETGVRVMVLCPGLTKTRMTAGLSQVMSKNMFNEDLSETLSTHAMQGAEHVAAAMIELLKKGENGSIWVIQNEQPPMAVNLPDYNNCMVPV